MQELAYRDLYGPEGSLRIESLGSIAVSIANRWYLGWPERVQALLDSRIYLVNLDAQLSKELDVIAEAVGLDHLTHHELMQMHGIDEAPPLSRVVKRKGVSLLEGNAVWPLPRSIHYAEPLTEAQRANIAAERKRQEAFTW